jgi:hypothetical protein
VSSFCTEAALQWNEICDAGPFLSNLGICPSGHSQRVLTSGSGPTRELPASNFQERLAFSLPSLAAFAQRPTWEPLALLGFS